DMAPGAGLGGGERIGAGQKRGRVGGSRREASEGGRAAAKADPTGRVAGAGRGLLEPGEDGAAAGKAQRRGARPAQREGAATGAISGATDTPYAARGGTDPDHARWLEQAVSLGIAPEAAQRVIHLFLVITSSRVLLVRR